MLWIATCILGSSMAFVRPQSALRNMLSTMSKTNQMMFQDEIGEAVVGFGSRWIAPALPFMHAGRRAGSVCLAGAFTFAEISEKYTS